MVYDLYLESIEGHWLVDRLWEANVTFFLLHNKLLKVAILLGLWTVSLSRVLTTWQTSLWICDLFVWSGFSRCSVFWEYLVCPNMVSEILWRATFGFDLDLEPVLPKLWKGFWFYTFYAFVDYGSCSIASKVPFLFGNSFRFTKNHFRLFQKHPFRQI